MTKNTMGKTRPVDRPYLIYRNLSGWEWRVLKAYSADPHKPYGRWFCAVTSAYTGGGADWGDTYIWDVVAAGGGALVYRDPDVPDSAVPDRARVPKPALPW